MDDPSVLTAGFVGTVDDPVLDDLTARDELFAPMGGDGDSSKPDDGCPWRFRIPPPIAVDLRRVQSVLPESDLTAAKALAAFAGPGSVVLLTHRMTALARPGEKPPPVWGMGYTASLMDIADADTFSVAPDTGAEKFATAAGHLDVGLNAAGRFGVGAALGAAAALTALPLPIPDIQFRTSAGTEFAIRFRLDLSALRVQAGPAGSGGAEWNLYRRGKDLVRTQVLMQTVFVPREADRLRVRVEAWIRRKSLFGTNRKSGHWATPPAEHDVLVR